MSFLGEGPSNPVSSSRRLRRRQALLSGPIEFLKNPVNVLRRRLRR